MRDAVLHLFEADPAHWPAHDALRAVARPGDVVCVLGARAPADALRALPARLVRETPPLGCPPLAWRALRRRIEREGAPSLVHAWSAPCLRLARLATPRTPRVASLFDAPPTHACRGARWASPLRGARAVSFGSAALREAWARLDPMAAQGSVAPAPIEQRPEDRASRDADRLAWGAAPGQLVVAYVGARGRAPDAFRAAFYTGLFTLAGSDAMGVYSTRTPGRERSERFTRRHGRRWRIAHEPRPERDWIGSADVVVACSRPTIAGARTRHDTGDALPALAWAMACRVPVIAQDTPGTRAMLDARCAVFIPPHTPVAIARALRALHDDSSPTRTMLADASERALRMCSREAFVRTVEDMHRHALASPA